MSNSLHAFTDPDACARTIQAEAYAANQKKFWCGPTLVALLTGKSYKDVVDGYRLCWPKRYAKKAELDITYASDTMDLARGLGNVSYTELDAYAVMKEKVQDNIVVTEGAWAKPTVTRVLRRLPPGLYAICAGHHIFMVHRRAGNVYDTKNPCLRIYDNRTGSKFGRPVGRKQDSFATASVRRIYRIDSATNARPEIAALLAG